MAGMGTPCVVCGMVPTRTVTIRTNVGVLFMFRLSKLEKPLCRIHGPKTARQYLGKTLLLGWWGVLSFWVNIFVVLSDLKVLGAFHGLADPGQPGATPARPVALGTFLKNVPVLPRQGEWRPDPFMRHQFRWIVGSSEWSDQVCDDGQVSVDPPGWVTTVA
jgi:hypothetical protein